MNSLKKTSLLLSLILPLGMCWGDDTRAAPIIVPLDYNTLVGETHFPSNGSYYMVTNGQEIQACLDAYKPKLKTRANQEASKLPMGLGSVAKGIIKKTLNIKQALSNNGGIIKINLKIVTPRDLKEIQEENLKKGKKKALAVDLATDEKYTLDGAINALDQSAYYIMYENLTIGKWPAKFTSNPPKTPRILSCPIKVEKANIACKRA